MQPQLQNQRQQTLSDKDIVNDILTSTKHVSSVYHLGILEANCQNTRQAFYDLHNHTLDQHLTVLETMKNKGWY